MTQRWVKDIERKKWHLLERPSVRVYQSRAWHLTACSRTVEGRVFRDGFPPGADCQTCLQSALARKAVVDAAQH